MHTARMHYNNNPPGNFIVHRIGIQLPAFMLFLVVVGFFFVDFTASPDKHVKVAKVIKTNIPGAHERAKKQFL